jgi:hypothetical protein
MNILQTILVIGLFVTFLVFAIAPVTNVTSNINDRANVSGFAGFFFGNLTFFIFIAFLVVIMFMMWGG